MLETAPVEQRYFKWMTGAILAAALALRWPVPAPTWTHFDEIAFIVLPLGFWGGDLNPHYFNYPTFHFYVTSLCYFLHYLAVSAEPLQQFVAYRFLVDGRDLLPIARGLNALLSVATVAVTACLGRRLYGAREGLLAALFLATMPLAVRFAYLAITDTPAVFWATLALLWAVRARQEGRGKDCLLAGVFTGLAGATKYPGALVAVPVAMAIWQRWPGARGRGLWTAGAAALLTFALATPFTWLDPGQFWYHFSDMGRTHLLSLSDQGEWAWLYHLRHTLRHGLGAAGLAAAGTALLWSSWRRQWQEQVLLVAFAAFAVAPVLATSTFMRYALPLAPLLALLVARLAAQVCKYRLLAGLVVLALVAEPLYAALRTRELLGGEDTREEARRWIETRVPQNRGVVELSSECGRLELLTPKRVFERQTHFLRSYGMETLLRAYALLAERDDLPPLYLDLDGQLDRLEPWSRDGTEAPVVLVSSQHPVCPDQMQPEARQLLGACRWEVTFTPGRLDAAVYDRMDWYFLPIAGFGQVEKTGPLIRLGLLSLPGPAGRVDARPLFAALPWLLRGHLAREKADWEGALQAYGQVLEGPVAPAQLLGLEMGRYLYTQMGKTHAQLGHRQEAVRFLEEAASLKPADREAHNELAIAYAAAGELEKAVQTWEELISLSADFAPAYFNMGRALLQLGRHQQARACWQKAVELMPDHPLAEQVRRWSANGQEK